MERHISRHLNTSHDDCRTCAVFRKVSLENQLSLGLRRRVLLSIDTTVSLTIKTRVDLNRSWVLTVPFNLYPTSIGRSD